MLTVAVNGSHAILSVVDKYYMSGETSPGNTKMKKDSPKHAPESGEPTEAKPVKPKSTPTTKQSTKDKPGKPQLGEDFESGRADAEP